MTTNEKRNPPLSVGYDIADELRGVLRSNHPAPFVWLANRITEAVNAARGEGASAPPPVPSAGDGIGDGRRPDATSDETLKAACEPWRFGVGDPPADESPLIGPYSAGIGYAIDRLAKLTNAGQYVGADGSETFEGDVDGTIMNVLRSARLYDDETGTFGYASAPGIEASR